MAELHKFQDDVRSEEDRSKPIKVRHLDDNFTIVRTKIATNLEGFIRIKETAPKSDEIEFVTAPPSSGEYAAVFRNGVFAEWMEIDECE